MITDPTHTTLPSTVDNIADAVTHARFVGSDQASDGVVLMKIIQVLRTLMLSPEGSALTNESVCEVMLSCFRICFEPRLNELLRRTAEHALKDIILLLFMRLPQFSEERNVTSLIKKLKMVANGGIEQTTKRRKTSKIGNKYGGNKSSLTSAHRVTPPINRTDDQKSGSDEPSTPVVSQLTVPGKDPVLATTPLTPLVGNIVDMQGKITQTPQSSLAIEPKTIPISDESVENDADVEENDYENPITNNDFKSPIPAAAIKPVASTSNEITINKDNTVKGEDFVNSMGVRFTPQSENGALNVQNLSVTNQMNNFVI